MVAILSTFRELERLRQIYVVLVRHGFADVARRLGMGAKGDAKAKPDAGADPELVAAEQRGTEEAKKNPLAERVRLVAMDLGPTFVKLGQIVSTRTDVLPADWIVELKKLQDEVAPISAQSVKEAIEASLGAPVDTLFESFEDQPLAAASIAQVHRAELKTEGGTLGVVVKVQRPGIRSKVMSDLELLHHLARLVESAIPESKIYNPVALVEEFDRAITAELDFLLEADNLVRFRKNFEGHPIVRFPAVHKSASAKAVLTLELLPGKKVYDAIRDDGVRGEAIAKASVGVVIKMILEDGFFHADPHPGNILISGTAEAPIIGLIDVGMVGRLSPEMRDRCIDLMVGIARQDYVAIADALYAISLPTRRVDMRAFRAHVALVAEKYLGRQLKDIQLAGLIGDLVGGAKKFGLEVPPDFLLVGKSLMTIEGVAKEIYPELNVEAEVRPFVIELMKKRWSPQRIGNEVLRGIEKIGASTYDLPQLSREVLDDLRMGKLIVTTNDTALPHALDRLGRRLFSAVIAGSFALAGAWLRSAGEPTLGGFFLALAVLWIAGHLGLALLRRSGR
ncbi:MAG: AarF/ABC1/UbiB kinase family protein [Polyangiaceae bacterium]|jgi:ubiquinone biosynthesis protein|nr:AarF/ABC1/UbiB kinase family protein [Polyangiaceae bacterium]MBK8942107.1 AarF/ABC1/UbiB kinase family protein [Polyangiaceae bacterium]